MRIFFFLFPFLGVLSCYGALVPQTSLVQPKVQTGEAETTIMRHLINNTAQQLEIQKEILQLMEVFQQQRKEFAEGAQSKGHASQMVRTARQIYESLQAHHLEHLFPADYVEELLFFSSIAGKNKLTSP